MLRPEAVPGLGSREGAPPEQRQTPSAALDETLGHGESEPARATGDDIGALQVDVERPEAARREGGRRGRDLLEGSDPALPCSKAQTTRVLLIEPVQFVEGPSQELRGIIRNRVQIHAAGRHPLVLGAQRAHHRRPASLVRARPGVLPYHQDAERGGGGRAHAPPDQREQPVPEPLVRHRVPAGVNPGQVDHRVDLVIDEHGFEGILRFRPPQDVFFPRDLWEPGVLADEDPARARHRTNSGGDVQCGFGAHKHHHGGRDRWHCGGQGIHGDPGGAQQDQPIAARIVDDAGLRQGGAEGVRNPREGVARQGHSAPGIVAPRQFRRRSPAHPLPCLSLGRAGSGLPGRTVGPPVTVGSRIVLPRSATGEDVRPFKAVNEVPKTASHLRHGLRHDGDTVLQRRSAVAQGPGDICGVQRVGACAQGLRHASRVVLQTTRVGSGQHRDERTGA